MSSTHYFACNPYIDNQGKKLLGEGISQYYLLLRARKAIVRLIYGFIWEN